MWLSAALFLLGYKPEISTGHLHYVFNTLSLSQEPTMRSLLLALPLILGSGCTGLPAASVPPLEVTTAAGTIRIWRQSCHMPDQYGFSYAEHQALAGAVTRGCWVVLDGHVLLVFDDMDVVKVPLTAFHPAGTAAPAKPGRGLI